MRRRSLIEQTFIRPVADLFREGGWVLYLIAATSVIAWTLILREWLALRDRIGQGWSRIEKSIEQLGNGNFQHDPLEKEQENVVAQVLQQDFILCPQSRESFEAQVTPLLQSESLLLESTLRTIAVLAGAMPLLGLLGTVLGMMHTFGALTSRQATDIDALAGGISQALITTQAGLVVSVPVLLMHGYLRSRIYRYLDAASVMMKKIEAILCQD